MATPFTESIDQVVSLFRAVFEHVAVLRREERTAVAILEMRGDYGAYRVQLQEIWRTGGFRKYAYYVLLPSKIVTGFDNAADPRALRLKYGPDAGLHQFEPVPHRHTEDKAMLELTDEMDCAAFVTWLRANLSSIREAGPTWTAASQDDEWRDGGEFARRIIANNCELFEELARL
jgi:hypothetical protein